MSDEDKAEQNQFEPVEGATEVVNSHEQEMLAEFKRRDEAMKKAEETTKTVAQKISDEARRQNGGEPKPLDWNTWTVADLEPKGGLTLGELKEELPDLINVLETPSGEVEVRRDRVDDNTRIVAFGHWRNPDSNYSAIRFTLSNEGDSPRTIRTVSLEAGRELYRTWENIGWIRDLDGYMKKDREGFLSAMTQADKLVDKVLQQEHSANFTSHTEKVGKAFWEK